MTKAEQLQQRMDELVQIIKQKRESFLGSEDDKGDEESMYKYMHCADIEEAEYDKLSRQYRVIIDAELEKWDGNGHLMTLQDFVESCQCGGFIDYDGSGVYSDGQKESNVPIYASDIEVGNYRKDFTHVIWYNR